MKKLLKVLFCLSLLFAMSTTSEIFAKEDEVVEEQSILEKFDSESIELSSTYINNLKYCAEKFNLPDYLTAYNEYKNYFVLYQQNTGLNTESDFGMDIVINGNNVGHVNPFTDKSWLNYEYENMGYSISSKIKSNSAENKEFLKNPKDFNILAEVTLTDKDGMSVSVEKVIPAKVVEVKGKIINRKQKTVIKESIEYYDGFSLQDFHSYLEIELFDGTIKNTKILGQGGGFINDGIHFSGGLDGSYDIQYLCEGASSLYMQTEFWEIYLIDEDGNIVDNHGKVLVPNNERKIVEFVSSNDAIKLSAKQGTLPDTVKFNVTEKTNLNLKKHYVAYDMNVQVDDNIIQPLENVIVSLPIPKEFVNKDIVVHYLNDKNELEEIESEIKEDKVYFETNHFSTYVLTERKTNTDDENTILPPNSNDNENLEDNDSSAIKNESPNTGDDSNILLNLILISTSLTMIGYLINKKRLEKQN